MEIYHNITSGKSKYTVTYKNSLLFLNQMECDLIYNVLPIYIREPKGFPCGYQSNGKLYIPSNSVSFTLKQNPISLTHTDV